MVAYKALLQDTVDTFKSSAHMGGHCSLEAREYDASCLSCWQTCHRKFYYSYILGLQPAAKRVAMDFGEKMHEVLSTRTEQGLEEALKLWESWPPSSSVLHTKERGIALTKEFDRWVSERKVDVGREVVGNEIIFKLAMLGGSFLTGRIDLVVREAGFNYVRDYKTTSRLGPTFFDQFRPHLQMTGYCYACRELKGSCAGAIITAINTSDMGKIRFDERITSRSEYELDLYALDTYPTLIEEIESAIQCRKFPLYESNCNQYYVMCPFNKLCIHGCTESIIDMFYVRPTPKVEEVDNA